MSTSAAAAVAAPSAAEHSTIPQTATTLDSHSTKTQSTSSYSHTRANGNVRIGKSPPFSPASAAQSPRLHARRTSNSKANQNANQKSGSGVNMDQVKLLFGSIDIHSLGYITRYQFEETLRDCGINLNDNRLVEVKRRLNERTIAQHAHSHPHSHPPLSKEPSLESATSTSSAAAAPGNAARPNLSRATSTSAKSSESASTIDSSERIDVKRFAYIIQPNASLIERVIKRQLVIPDWNSFVDILTDIYHDVKHLNEGKVADYIPELALAQPDWFGVSFCSVDGQVFSIGDTYREFSVQSSSKPICYLLALDELGEEEVHRYVGREPSGRNFNDICLNPESIPHNPMVNSGAIMVCSLIKHGLEQSARFRYIMDKYNAISGNAKYFTFSNSTYLSERATADRNFCLGFMMQENDSFNLGSTRLRHLPGRPWGANDLVKNLELYFQCCSIQTNAEGQAVTAATLANGGKCALTEEQLFTGNHVRNCLALMLSCGMYDYSGEWAYKIGLPAKSGVSGCLMVVIPNVGGLSIYSPPLDALGNTVRGIEFCKRLVDRCSFHYFDMVNGIVSSSSTKINPCSDKNSSYQNELITLCSLCAKGDLTGIRAILSAGADVNAADYDGRTALHLAASGGQLAVVKYLISHSEKNANSNNNSSSNSGSQKLKLNPVDRWGGTPFSDAIREGHQAVAEYLFAKLKQAGISPAATPASFTPASTATATTNAQTTVTK